MKNLILNSIPIKSGLNSFVAFVRGWFDPAMEGSPYDRALRQHKVERVNYTPRLMPRRRFSLR